MSRNGENPSMSARQAEASTGGSSEQPSNGWMGGFGSGGFGGMPPMGIPGMGGDQPDWMPKMPVLEIPTIPGTNTSCTSSIFVGTCFRDVTGPH